jgi:hypothetical protein
VLVGILAGYGFAFGRAWAGGAAALGLLVVVKIVDREIAHAASGHNGAGRGGGPWVLSSRKRLI